MQKVRNDWNIGLMADTHISTRMMRHLLHYMCPLVLGAVNLFEGLCCTVALGWCLRRNRLHYICRSVSVLLISSWRRRTKSYIGAFFVMDLLYAIPSKFVFASRVTGSGHSSSQYSTERKLGQHLCLAV